MSTILTVWFMLSLVIAFWGSTREIGFIGAMIVSVLLSPLAGLVFVLLSPRKMKKLKI
ncbi:MAG: hypothetical protein KFF73_01210 [Cyclobacteriaceae bacterium]|nr:hypothetical protein [Cyclobacteriaceae bacterium]